MTEIHDPSIDDDIDPRWEKYYNDGREYENQLIDEITEVIRRFIKRRYEEGRRPALRDAHARDNGCVRAIFRVDSDLDEELQHGAFYPGNEYQAWIRFSNGNSELLNGRWPDARGMAIKLMGVPGQKLLEDERDTQDFIMANNPVFFIDDLKRYKDTLDIFHSGGLFKQYCSVIRLKWPERILAFNVNATLTTNPLFDQYWSMTPYRLGSDPARKHFAIKFTAKPRLGKIPNFLNRAATFLSPNFSLKTELSNALARSEMWFDFYIQRHVDDRTPIENSKVEWKESVSKPEHVAKIIIPSQEPNSAERDNFCEHLSFSPWHCLPEHKPLGAVNRIRKVVYLRISQYRHQLNGVPMKEPTLDEAL